MKLTQLLADLARQFVATFRATVYAYRHHPSIMELSQDRRTCHFTNPETGELIASYKL